MVCARSRASRRLNSDRGTSGERTSCQRQVRSHRPGRSLCWPGQRRSAGLARGKDRHRPAPVVKKPSEHHRVHDIGASTRGEAVRDKAGRACRDLRRDIDVDRRATRRARYDAHRSSQMTGLLLPTTSYDMRPRWAQKRDQSNLARRSLLTHSLTNARTVLVCSFD